MCVLCVCVLCVRVCVLPWHPEKKATPYTDEQIIHVCPICRSFVKCSAVTLSRNVQ